MDGLTAAAWIPRISQPDAQGLDGFEQGPKRWVACGNRPDIRCSVSGSGFTVADIERRPAAVASVRYRRIRRLQYLLERCSVRGCLHHAWPRWVRARRSAHRVCARRSRRVPAR